MPLTNGSALKTCPVCQFPAQVSGLFLYPMTFDEIDEATKAAEALKANKRHNRKRKNSEAATSDLMKSAIDVSSEGHHPAKQLLQPDKENSRKRTFDETKSTGSNSKDKDPSDCRTGRWTPEEIVFCDKLISLFKDGKLPLVAGTKLNDFLASMLKSKQSRLTKKMKNAKLSSKVFKGSSCFVTDTNECTEMSELEGRFFQSILDPKERAEFKFHMRREWRDTFSNFCLQIGQPIDADAWLSSVEEMDRRVAMARDASRIARRKLMMGYALCQDFQTAEAGVFIERSQAEITAAQNSEPLKANSAESMTLFNPSETDEVLALLNDDFNDRSDHHGGLNFTGEAAVADYDIIGKSSILHSSPFLTKVMAYIKRHNVPFEHVDVWVPNVQDGIGSKCLLGFAGCATAETEMPNKSRGPVLRIDPDEKFNLLAFGDYSQKFSFSEGCGLPGRVFNTRAPIWEDKAHDINHQFERCGGAVQWGIKTVVGIPLPSPNVGRIVICLYSRHTRARDDGLLRRLTGEFAKLLPTPRWKLVIDMSTPCPNSAGVNAPRTQFPVISSFSSPDSTAGQSQTVMKDSRIEEIVELLGDELSNSMRASNFSGHVESLTGLRLFLLKSSHNAQDTDVISTLVGSYSSYQSSGRSRTEVALMLSKDYSFLMKANISDVASTNQQQNFFVNASQGQYGTIINSNSYQNIASNFRQQQSQTPYTISSRPASSHHPLDPSEMSLAPSDPSVSFYPIHEGPGLEHFRSHSPTMMPIVSGAQPSGSSVDNLSVVSH